MSNMEVLYEEIQMKNYHIRALLMTNIFTLHGNESFYEWLNKFEYVADMIKVPNDKMIQLFVNMVDNDVHNLIKHNYYTVNFSQLSYDDIINYYLYYFVPNHKCNLHRIRFLCRNQYEEESIEKYVYNLRKIYNKCDDNKFHLENKLLRQFLCGIRDYEMKTYLNNFGFLSFDEAVAKAIEYEKANDITYYLDKASAIIHTYYTGYKRSFYKWLNKFEYVADILEIPDTKMVKFFNKMVNDDVHTSVKEANPSVNFYILSYEDIINCYLSYFTPSKECDLHMKRFICRKQYEQEPLQKYANRLRKIYNNCSAIERTEENLIERFVSGIRDDDLRIYLNKTFDLSFDETVEKAIQFAEDNDLSNYLIPARTMIRNYNPDKEVVFYYWLNKFEFVADYVGVPNTRMVQFFNKMVKNDVHRSVQEANPSVKLFELSFDEMINYYLRYFSSCYESDLHRNRFTCRVQYGEETIEKYADSLRKIYNKCIHSNYSEDALSEQFINGIRNDFIRIYLGNMPKISYDKTVEFAVTFTKELNSLRDQ